MNAVAKLLIFGIIVNLASGLLLDILPIYTTSNEFTGGMTYDANKTNLFVSELNGSVNPGGEIEDAGNQIYRVLDFLRIGYIGRFIRALQNYLFGFPEILRSMFLSFIDPVYINGIMVQDAVMINRIFNVLETMIGIGYLLMGWWLWTGTRVLQ